MKEVNQENNTAQPIQSNEQLALINTSIDVFKTAGDVLQENQLRSYKAIEVGGKILDQWNTAWAIENEDERLKALAAADERSNKYLVNCGAALKEEKALRETITKLMDEFKRMFTGCENDIDKTKANTVPNKIQNNRDTYVQEQHKINERKRQEAERKAAAASERIEICGQYEKGIIGKLSSILTNRKLKMQGAFNGILLEEFKDKSLKLQNLTITPPTGVELMDAIGDLILTFVPRYFSGDALNDVKREVITGYDYSSFSDQYQRECLDLKSKLVSELPSKLAELQDQKRAADEAEAKRQEELRQQELAENKRQEEMAAAKGKAEKERLAREAEQARIAEAENMARIEREAREEKERLEKEQREREEAEQRRIQQEAEAAKRKDEDELDIKKQGEKTMALFEKEADMAEASNTPESRQGFEIIVKHPIACGQIFQLWFENEGKNLPVDKILKTSVDQMKSWCEKHAHKNDVKIDSKFLEYKPTFKAVNRKVTPAA